MFEVRGYFADPSKPVRGGLAMFTYRERLDTFDNALAIARGWFACDRYPFIFVYDLSEKREVRVFENV
jgi:hypothetical protein